jgi:hypothetical protein
LKNCTLFAAFKRVKPVEVTIEPAYKNLTRWYSECRRRQSAKA